MEVKGEKSAEAYRKLHGHLICQPCDNKGQQVAATGYCEDCSEYLCQKCYDVHTMPTPSKDHRLLDVRAMPKSSAAAAARGKPPVSKGTLPCPQHSSKIVEFYCITHNTEVCGACAHKHHRNCDTEDIGEVSEDFNQSHDYRVLSDNMNQEDNIADLLEKAVATSIQDTETSADKTIRDIDIYRDKLVDRINKLVREMKSSFIKQKTEDINKLRSLQQECQSKKNELQAMKFDLEKHAQNNNDLYVMYQKVSHSLPTLHKKLTETANSNVAHVYTFKSDRRMDELLSANISLGSITKSEQVAIPPLTDRTKPRTRSGVTPASHARAERSLDLATCKLTALPDLCVETEEDKMSCNINGAAVLSPGRMLVADCSNDSVKCVYTPTNTVTSTLKLSSWPWDVTSLSGDQAAVTMPDVQQVQVISTRGALSTVHIFSVNGSCRGINSTRDKLVISYANPPKVEILDHEGGVLHTIQHSNPGWFKSPQPLFKSPWYVAVRREGSQHMIYVSDFKAHKVVKMTETGKILFTYTHPDLRSPSGLTVTDQGQLLICSRKTHQLHLVSPSGQWINTLLKGTDGLSRPQSVSVCQEENKLYISNYSKNNIKVYRISQ